MKTITEGLDEAYKNAGHNAYFENGFKSGVEFAQRWIPVEEELPPKLKRVNCQVLFSRNKAIWNIIAQYVPYMTVPEEDYMDDAFAGESDYNEEEDQYYTPEGWYECNLYSEINYHVSDEVIAWRPIEYK
jgi:hypothetical protein